ncbi:MAG: hypothetical protein INR62_13930 [Rhodospirillales bacterium]|nr:hypothetical protein [Acetobacter sp.]
MLTLKTSVATTAIVATALVSASIGYVVSRMSVTAQVAVSCPEPQRLEEKPFPPIGVVPPTTGGRQF